MATCHPSDQSGPIAPLPPSSGADAASVKGAVSMMACVNFWSSQVDVCHKFPDPGTRLLCCDIVQSMLAQCKAVRPKAPRDDDK
jgi:hypothetical protein